MNSKKYDFRKIMQKNIRLLSVCGVVLVIILGSLVANSITLKTFNAFGGIIWASEGIHYIDQQEIDSRIVKINAPYEQKIENEITQNTLSCDRVDSGYCQQSTSVFAIKTLITPAVAYVPGTPDTKQITGYCTLCRDGTFSPSCAVGRGACSWHGGVASYGVARYCIIPGKPAIEAKPAVYSYSTKTYKDSPNYVAPPTPSLEAIVANGN